MFSMHRDRFVAAGFGERMITPEELWEFEPNLMKNRSIIAALQTDEAVLNPIRLVSGFACAGLRQGAKINNYSPVVDFKTDGHRIISIITEKGEFHADKIIIAAGSWSRQVALKLGISIPEYYIQAEAVVTEPLPLLLNGFVYWGNVERIPKEIELANEALTKGWESRGNENMFASYDFGTVQTKRGNVLLGQMSYITPPFDWHATHQVMPGSARETMKLLPQLKNARILRSWRSPAPFTPDHLPLLGKLDGFDNLYIASGFQSAVTGCPWAGEFVADLVSGSKISSGFEQYDPGRFKQPIAI
jgi:glycine/D-amino acid oxidase-like deaminating enzyme